MADTPLGPLGKFYRSLLDLGVADAPEELLQDSLQLLVELTGAREAYIEVDDVSGSLLWFASVGCSPERVHEIRTTVSHGIIAQTLSSGQVIATSSALSDPRFADRESVRENEIEAVVCAPVGRGEVRGVVYIQGHADVMPVTDQTQQHLAYFGRAITPFLENHLARTRQQVGSQGPFAQLLFRSQVMKSAVERLRLAAPLDVDMLLTGPTGVGKSLMARLVHQSSRRAARPFVEINCAALPENLFENELFGADEGAHSAVPKGGIGGKLSAAEGGTLFLDEIGELSLASQAKLLTLLQSRTYYRLGSSRSRQADVRIITATNADLLERIRDKAFREDLFYRLNVLEVRVPPLSSRLEDIPLLASRFVRRAADRHSLDVRGLSPSALRAILRARWPGNVRELENRLESAVVSAHMRGAASVDAVDVFGEAPTAETSSESLSLQEATLLFQKQHVLSVLEGCNWNVSEAARRLDVVRSHVYNLMRLHGLERE